MERLLIDFDSGQRARTPDVAGETLAGIFAFNHSDPRHPRAPAEESPAPLERHRERFPTVERATEGRGQGRNLGVGDVTPGRRASDESCLPREPEIPARLASAGPPPPAAARADDRRNLDGNESAHAPSPILGKFPSRRPPSELDELDELVHPTLEAARGSCVASRRTRNPPRPPTRRSCRRPSPA